MFLTFCLQLVATTVFQYSQHGYAGQTINGLIKKKEKGKGIVILPTEKYSLFGIRHPGHFLQLASKTENERNAHAYRYLQQRDHNQESLYPGHPYIYLHLT